MLTASTQLKLHMQQQQPDGGWSCAVVNNNQRRLVRLPDEEAIVEFVADQLEQLFNQAASRIEAPRFLEREV